MNYSGIYRADCMNGTGFRVVLFVSGCSHGCHGCQNKQTWNPKTGMVFTDHVKADILDALKPNHINGLTLSGGDPLHQRNFNTILQLAKTVKRELPGKTIWLYTGYTLEQVKADLNLCQILPYIDVMVDGRFEKELLDKTLKFRGSKNQRLIDIPQTLQLGEVVTFHD